MFRSAVKTGTRATQLWPHAGNDKRAEVGASLRRRGWRAPDGTHRSHASHRHIHGPPTVRAARDRRPEVVLNVVDLVVVPDAYRAAQVHRDGGLATPVVDDQV